MSEPQFSDNSMHDGQITCSVAVTETMKSVTFAINYAGPLTRVQAELACAQWMQQFARLSIEGGRGHG